MSPGARASAYDQIRHTVLRWIEDQKVDPSSEPEIQERTAEAIRQWQRSAAASERRGLGDVEAIASRVVRSITGFGALDELFRVPGIEEIEIEGDLVMYIDASGRRKTLVAPTTEEENRQAVDRLLAATQRHLDTQSPMVHARVLDGRARLSGAIPPVSDKLSATVRFHQLRNESLSTMVSRGSLTVPAAGFLWATAQTRLSVVISGPPFAGNLKMRPDYIVVGEVLGAEAFEIVRAVNAGCGFACTVHANSARDALTALVNAAIMAGENVKAADVRAVFASSIKYVMHLEVAERSTMGGGQGLLRQTREIIELVPSLHDSFSHEVLFERRALGYPLEWTGTLPHHAEVIDRALPEGLSIAGILGGHVSPFELGLVAAERQRGVAP